MHVRLYTETNNVCTLLSWPEVQTGIFIIFSSKFMYFWSVDTAQNHQQKLTWHHYPNHEYNYVNAGDSQHSLRVCASVITCHKMPQNAGSRTDHYCEACDPSAFGAGDK